VSLVPPPRWWVARALIRFSSASTTPLSSPVAASPSFGKAGFANSNDQDDDEDESIKVVGKGKLSQPQTPRQRRFSRPI